MRYLSNFILILILLSLIILKTNDSLAYKFKFIAIGDAPYMEPGGSMMFKKLVDQVNKVSHEFVIHIGDIKSGAELCSDQNILNAFNLLNSFKKSVYYTPGDNEWTDCHREAAGKMDPLERLAFVRKTFFSKPESLGKAKNKYVSQAQYAGYSSYPENYFFKYGGGLFSSLNLPGSDNNRDESNKTNLVEFENREKANVFWIDEIFKNAKNEKFLVLFYHAEIGWGAESNKFKGYEIVKNKILEKLKDWNKPVLFIHGDEHVFKLDHPITFTDPKTGIFGQRSNILRLEVYGFPDVRAIEVSIDTELNQPFSFKSLDEIKWEYKKE